MRFAAGILLRRLLSDPDVEGVTVIVVDEVHERSVDSDLLLYLLKELLLRKGVLAPKIILMSATADAQLFASYFEGPSKVILAEAAVNDYSSCLF